MFLSLSNPNASLVPELELEEVLEQLKCGADMAKEEVQKDAVWHWKAVKAWNEQHKWMCSINKVLEDAFVSLRLEVHMEICSRFWS